jgi:sec-independent protein translocase protein TatA
MFGSLGIWEILLIVVVIAVLFGGKKLPQLGKGLGEGIMNFKNSLRNDPEKPKKREESDSDDEKDNRRSN